MKAHKYWSIGAVITMLGAFYTGYKGEKETHRKSSFPATRNRCETFIIERVKIIKSL